MQAVSLVTVRVSSLVAQAAASAFCLSDLSTTGNLAKLFLEIAASVLQLSASFVWLSMQGRQRFGTRVELCRGPCLVGTILFGR